jgi:branched-chain amino acid transport system substrate-binding protein
VSALRRGVPPALLLAAAALLAACGGQLTDAQVRVANGVTVGQANAPSATTVPTSGSVALPAGQGAGTAAAPAGPILAPTSTGPPRLVMTQGAPFISGTASPSPQHRGPSTRTTSATSVDTPGQTGPIVIGSVGNYSGPAAAGVAGLPRAVQVWAAMINSSGGLFGRQVQVIVEDDGGDPTTYGSDVQDLVENRHVVAFVAQGATLSAQGGSDFLQSHGIPIIGTDCARPDWTSFTNAFLQCPAGESVVSGLMKFGKQIVPAAKLGYVYCVEAPACTQQAPEVDKEGPANGLPVVYKAQISITTIDFTSNCQAAQQAGANLFFVAGDPNTLERLAASCDRQDYHPQFIQPSISVKVTSNRAPGLRNLALVSFVFPFHGVSGNPAIDEFTSAYARFDKQETPGPADAQGWAAAKLFQLAATKAAGAEHMITPSSLTAALKTVKGEMLGGLTVPLIFTTFPASPAPCAFTLRSDPATLQWTAPNGDSTTC